MEKPKPEPKAALDRAAADAAPPEADAEARERYWQERTNAVHDAAEAFYKNTPPKRKLPKDGKRQVGPLPT